VRKERYRKRPLRPFAQRNLFEGDSERWEGTHLSKNPQRKGGRWGGVFIKGKKGRGQKGDRKGDKKFKYQEGGRGQKTAGITFREGTVIKTVGGKGGKWKQWLLERGGIERR